MQNVLLCLRLFIDFYAPLLATLRSVFERGKGMSYHRKIHLIVLVLLLLWSNGAAAGAIAHAESSDESFNGLEWSNANLSDQDIFDVAELFEDESVDYVDLPGNDPLITLNTGTSPSSSIVNPVRRGVRKESGTGMQNLGTADSVSGLQFVEDKYEPSSQGISITGHYNIDKSHFSSKDQNDVSAPYNYSSYNVIAVGMFTTQYKGGGWSAKEACAEAQCARTVVTLLLKGLGCFTFTPFAVLSSGENVTTVLGQPVYYSVKQQGEATKVDICE